MNANQMTPKELRELANKKEKEDKPIKFGYLKCDLYAFQSTVGYNGIHFYKMKNVEFLQSKEQKDELIKEFASRFIKVVSKGDRFECYLDDNIETWWSEFGDVESMDSEWAEKYLENITKI